MEKHYTGITCNSVHRWMISWKSTILGLLVRVCKDGTEDSMDNVKSENVDDADEDNFRFQPQCPYRFLNRSSQDRSARRLCARACL